MPNQIASSNLNQNPDISSGLFFIREVILMSTLTPELKEAYANAINILFGGAVQASPSEITPTVVQYVDTMMKEIVNCSANITGLLTEMVGVLYDITLSEAVGNVILKFRNDLLGEIAADQVNNVISSVLQELVEALLGNRQFVGCLYVARANWRSAITIELMGI